MRATLVSAGASSLVLIGYADAALAHDSSASGSSTLRALFNVDPLVVALLALAAGFYLMGVARLWRRAGRARGVRPLSAMSFAAGWMFLVIALVSPLDGLGGRQLSAHMLQHELLMLVAAPLLVLGRPLQAWLWAIGARGRKRIGRVVRLPGTRVFWRALTGPLGAWILHASAIWVWHAPTLFQRALLDTATHTLQHTSFLVAGLLFWWSVLGRLRQRVDHGAAAVSLFTTMLHTGALGALLTFSSTLWYPSYVGRGNGTWESALVDQNVAGLIMWIPGGFVYMAAALAIGAHWFLRVMPIAADAGSAQLASASRSGTATHSAQ